MLAEYLKLVAVLVGAVAMTLHAAPSGEPTVRLLTLDPGHFHASLVQKFMYPQVSPVVHVYAPQGPDLKAHLDRVESFNTRSNDPTHWEETVFTGPDFLDRMIQEKAGNVVVIAGNNARKTEYIARSVDAGLNVLADKPMAITPAEFELLRKTFNRASEKHVLLYDIMTERFEITTVLQRELAQMPDVFGKLEKGTPANPAVVMESVHHFLKEVAGKPLIRPAWSFDPRQQGEAVPDVGTHLVDLVQWECFPKQALDWHKDVKVNGARRWATALTPEQFQRVTGLDSYPDFLKKDVGADNNLNVFENGEVSFEVRGVNAKITALWKYEAPAGAKDSHYSVLRGSRAELTIKQGVEQNYQPTLYVRNVSSKSAADGFEHALRGALAKLCKTWPGLEMKPSGDAWEIVVPDKYALGHEAHFSQVTENFLQYFKNGKLPAWEVPNMLSKYYITTEAYRLSHARQ
jgi:predicted dehydrogenase